MRIASAMDDNKLIAYVTSNDDFFRSILLAYKEIGKL